MYTFSDCKELFKQNILWTLCRLGLLTKSNITFNNDNAEIVNIDNNSVIPIITTSNIIYEIEQKSKKWFFRECRMHLPKEKYVECVIDDFNKFICSENYDPEIVNFYRFFNMGTAANRMSRVSIYFRNNCANVVGLKHYDEARERETQKKFVEYVWSEFYSYKLNGGVRRDQPQVYNAIRAISYYKMAQLLGLERLVPETRFIKVILNRDVRLGSWMEEANGISFLEIMGENRKDMVNPILQRELLNLNLLDVICYEKDHRPDNYNVLIDEHGKVYSISVFDNDSPMSFFVSGNVCFETYDGCSELVKKDKSINRPFLCKNTCEKILNMDECLLDETFSGLLTSIQIYYLKKRIHNLQEAIRNSCKSHTCVLLGDDEWCENTVKTELEGDFGLTYLGIFAGDWKNTKLERETEK